MEIQSLAYKQLNKKLIVKIKLWKLKKIKKDGNKLENNLKAKSIIFFKSQNSYLQIYSIIIQ